LYQADEETILHHFCFPVSRTSSSTLIPASEPFHCNRR
jgi:hypothetical protein